MTKLQDTNIDVPASTALPAALAEVLMVDAATCANTGGMSISWWLERVRSGEAPAPAIREPRCTRWFAKDVAEFYRSRALANGPQATAATAMQHRARLASTKALAVRAGGVRA